MTEGEINYDDYCAGAVEAGASPEDLEEAVAEMIRVAQALLNDKCPKCGAPSVRYVDYEQQQGPSNVPGAWVMYRCSTAPPPGQPRGGACDFLADLKEGEASN